MFNIAKAVVAACCLSDGVAFERQRYAQIHALRCSGLNCRVALIPRSIHVASRVGKVVGA